MGGEKRAKGAQLSEVLLPPSSSGCRFPRGIRLASVPDSTDPWTHPAGLFWCFDEILGTVLCSELSNKDLNSSPSLSNIIKVKWFPWRYKEQKHFYFLFSVQSGCTFPEWSHHKREWNILRRMGFSKCSFSWIFDLTPSFFPHLLSDVETGAIQLPARVLFGVQFPPSRLLPRSVMLLLIQTPVIGLVVCCMYPFKSPPPRYCFMISIWQQEIERIKLCILVFRSRLRLVLNAIRSGRKRTYNSSYFAVHILCWHPRYHFSFFSFSFTPHKQMSTLGRKKKA